MKKKWLLLTMCLMMIFLIGCGKEEKLLENAAPEQSALSVFKYDGQEVRAFWMFDETRTKKVLKEINDSKRTVSKEWSVDEVEAPIYGFSIMAKDETFLEIAWSNGYWIKSDGTVLKSDLNVPELEEKYDWKWTEQFDSINVIPCMQQLCLDENDWNPEFMTVADESNSNDGVELAIVEQTEKGLTVSISNQSDNWWEYGEYFSIEVCQEDTWYKVPTIPGEWAFNDISYVLEAGTTSEEFYNLEMYGTLPAGKYRIEIENHYAEFEVE